MKLGSRAGRISAAGSVQRHVERSQEVWQAWHFWQNSGHPGPHLAPSVRALQNTHSFIHPFRRAERRGMFWQTDVVLTDWFKPLTPIVVNMWQTNCAMQSAEIASNWRKKHTCKKMFIYNYRNAAIKGLIYQYFWQCRCQNMKFWLGWNAPNQTSTHHICVMMWSLKNQPNKIEHACKMIRLLVLAGGM